MDLLYVACGVWTLFACDAWAYFLTGCLELQRSVAGPLVISHKEGVTALPEGMKALARVGVAGDYTNSLLL